MKLLKMFLRASVWLNKCVNERVEAFKQSLWSALELGQSEYRQEWCKTLCSFCPCLYCIPICLDFWVEGLTGCCASGSGATGPFLAHFLACVGQKALGRHWKTVNVPMSQYQCGLRDDVPEQRKKRIQYFMTLLDVPGVLSCFLLDCVGMGWRDQEGKNFEPGGGEQSKSNRQLISLIEENANCWHREGVNQAWH